MAPGHLPPAWLRYRAAGDRPRRLGLDHRPGHRRRLERRRRRDALPVGLRLGRRWRSSARVDRAGLAVPRPVLDAPRPGRRGPAAGCTSRAGRSPTTRSGSVAGRPIIGFAFFVWLELVVLAGPSTLFIVLVGYTALTLAMMAQFGRDEWRSHGETFTVWFRLLGRLALLALVDEDGRVRRRSFGSGLLEPGWSRGRRDARRRSASSSIIFDGLSQTQPFFDLFGAPGIAEKTLLLFALLGIVVAARLRGRPDGRPRRDRRRASCRSRSATSSPTT